MIEELTDEGGAGRVGGVVSVVGAELGLGDEPNRSDLEGIVGIEHATGSAELDQRFVQLFARFGEGSHPIEDAPESAWTLRDRRGLDGIGLGLDRVGWPSTIATTIAPAATVSESGRYRRRPGSQRCRPGTYAGRPEEEPPRNDLVGNLVIVETVRLVLVVVELRVVEVRLAELDLAVEVFVVIQPIVTVSTAAAGDPLATHAVLLGWRPAPLVRWSAAMTRSSKRRQKKPERFGCFYPSSGRGCDHTT